MLDLTNTLVSDVGVEHLKGMNSLRRLRLYETKVTDDGLEHVAGLTSLYSLELNGTLVTVTDALFGHVSDGQIESLRSGWKQLFGDGLKPFVEAGA